MSEFDSIADSMWDEVESVFADDAVWSPEGLPDRAIRADVSSGFVIDTVGSQHNVIVMEFRTPSDGMRPGPKDHYRILTGPFKGSYRQHSTVSNDGITISVAVKPIERETGEN